VCCAWARVRGCGPACACAGTVWGSNQLSGWKLYVHTSFVSLLSSSARQKLSNSFALFLSSLINNSSRHCYMRRTLCIKISFLFPDKSLALCVSNIFLWITHRKKKVEFFYPRSEQRDNLLAMQRNCHWIVFWRQSFATQAPSLKLFSSSQSNNKVFIILFLLRIGRSSNDTFFQNSQYFHYKLNTKISNSQKQENICLSTTLKKFYIQRTLYSIFIIKELYKVFLYNLTQLSSIAGNSTNIWKTFSLLTSYTQNATRKRTELE
jgi:hypothetical protein